MTLAKIVIISIISIVFIFALGFECGRRFQAYIDDEWGG